MLCRYSKVQYRLNVVSLLGGIVQCHLNVVSLWKSTCLSFVSFQCCRGSKCCSVACRYSV